MRRDWRPQIARSSEPEKSYRVKVLQLRVFFERAELGSSTQPSQLRDALERKQSKSKETELRFPQLSQSSSSEMPNAKKSLLKQTSFVCYIQAVGQVAPIAINLLHSKSCYDQKESRLTRRPGKNILLVLLKII